jgi:hypothetical protein
MRRTTDAELERLEGGGASGARAGAALQRLLACTLIVQTVTALAVCTALVVCTVVLVNSVRDLDLNVVQEAIASALRSVHNVEDITQSVKESVGTVVGAVNRSATAIQSLNTLLEHPTVTLSMPSQG